MADEITLGAIQGSDEDLTLPYPTRSQHLYVVGVAGSGKSNLLEQIVYTDLLTGKGTAFLDPHGDSVEKLLRVCPPERINDVIYWDPAEVSRPFGLNPFFCEDTGDIREVASRAETFVDALASLYEFAEGFTNAPRMTVILQHLATTFVLNQGACLTEAVEFLSNDLYRERFYPALEGDRYRNVLAFWQNLDRRSDSQQRLIVESSISRLERLTSNPLISGIFGQPRNTIDFTQLMNEGKVLFVRLSASEMGPDNAAFIGSYIVWEIFQAAMRRGENRRPFYLTADEFQRFMTRAFSRIIEESRKFGLSVTVAHQNLSQLDTRLRGSVRDVANKVVFRVNPSDAQEFAPAFKVVVPENTGVKMVLCTNPYTYLKTHPSGIVQLVEMHAWLQMILTGFLEYLYGEMEGEVNYEWKYLKEDGTRKIQIKPNYTLVNYYFEKMEKGIDYSIWLSMSSNKETLLELLRRYLYIDAMLDIWPVVFLDNRFCKALDAVLLHVFDNLAWWMVFGNGRDEQREELVRSHISSPATSYKTCLNILHKVVGLVRVIMRFADTVNEYPIYLPDPTAVVERPRTYADVIAERANELATLQNYLARVRYVEGAELKDELIVTKRFEAEETAQARAKIMSRVRDFTTERHLVEQGITQRLKRPSSGTMKKYVPLRNQDEEAPHLFEDDDEPGFEER